MKTKDTYMKMSWITVTEESMDKERKCVVKHEKNRGGGDQEILFPAIKKVVPTMKPTEANLKNENAVTTINPREADLEVENDALRLQFTYTSAYWTYLLLLLKSVVYLAIVTFCLLRRTAAGGNGKSS
ncbi:Hypothetical predicted protein [Marmota monax]|uniref:Immunoglobulin C1-set domain-containing protein n=2 Tax=Marmota TaxID=9992 RepID=A0A5E4BZ36_MARMO|nr:hypothetical protein GHT09_010750 [Marmota monax]KAF7478197.1 hypothetical protein GHT09_010750 [Marmota monax]KAF7478198.1 hypothetical protein GHT09_010750 [Marmota monax]VTJ74250.1 Hypothetical predicted protein [Marmota monax]